MVQLFFGAFHTTILFIHFFICIICVRPIVKSCARRGLSLGRTVQSDDRLATSGSLAWNACVCGVIKFFSVGIKYKRLIAACLCKHREKFLSLLLWKGGLNRASWYLIDNKWGFGYFPQK